MTRAARAQGVCLALSPACAESGRMTAGVGVLARNRCRLTAVRPCTEAFAAHIKAGRAQAYLIDMGMRVPVLLVGVYGWTGAEARHEAMRCTQALFQAVCDEIAALGNPPHILCGDFNCELASVHALEQAL
eukprot:10624297-Alexandrium_andersonii.AAC.1